MVQASGTAIMMPLLMTTVMTLVPHNERGKMMGNISIVMSVAPAVGPVLTGFILNYFEWRTLFFVMLFILLRASLPRPRYDHMMAAGWVVCLPVTLLNLLVTGVVLLAKG